MRRAVPAPVRARGRTVSIPAPVRGWVENENLANNRGQGASVLENGFPLASTVRVRGGALKVATVGVAAVESLMVYRAGGTEKLFAATGSAIYDITLLNATTAPLPAVSGLSSGRWSYVQMDTGGGQFLIAVNGMNTGRYYDGTAWSALSVTGVSTAALSHVWIHANRLWAVQGGTMFAWYLPVDQIGGAAASFSLGGVFQRGGSLLFGATWSSDSGQGFGDRQVFVSDQGEIAVFEGIDPSDAATWRIVGRYDIGRPVSSQTMRAGGDLLIATTDGLVPMSQVATRDAAALGMVAVSQPIEPAWLRVTRTNSGGLPVQLLKWQREGMGIVGYPHRPGETHVVNLQTGAWAKWTGLDVQCTALFRDLAYFGDRAGNVLQFEATGADVGMPYVFRYSGLPDHLGAPGASKVVRMARATFRSLAPFRAGLSVATDYRREFPTAPNATIDTSLPALWDVGQWDVSQWDSGPGSEARVTATTRWRSIGRAGFSAAPQIQITCGSLRRPDAELVTFDLLYETGGSVV